MANSNIVIRIHTSGDAVDWNISDPSLLNFSDTMTAIHQVLPDNTVQAFEYDDEDGERITVRSDEELAAMVSFHISQVGRNDRSKHPLEIHPKTCKTPGKRNIHGLKVQTKDGENSVAVQSPASNDASGSRKRSGDIREILSGGNICDSDLQYMTVLGSGNCGTVYKAVHQYSGTVMAVKVINLDVTADCQKQIMAELEVLYRCNSPVIIGFYGAYFVENRISICAEFMDGGSLDRFGQVEEQILGRISVSIVKGLQYLWSLKIIHRDVKPSNILVNTSGDVKLCDFGVSVQLIDSIAKTYIGTNAYMAPERILGEQYSIHSDVWSLGVSLFELATAKFPYESAKKANAKPIDLMKSIVGKEPPCLPNGAFTPAFVNFVSHCMTKNPLSRPAPQALMRHPFIESYNDGNKEMVAAWVHHRLAMQNSS